MEVWKFIKMRQLKNNSGEVDDPELDIDEYDSYATRSTLIMLSPVIIGIAIHSLMITNDVRNGGYSWIIQTSASIVYAWGFAVMVPQVIHADEYINLSQCSTLFIRLVQLYINYKLKSVAHLPWKQLTFKFLNTVIDDLFSFLFPLPWIHRVACFRDDIIFLGYCYQVRSIDHKAIVDK